ncbi:histone H2B type 1-A-like [Mesoplodon densirostris]|uniref:histone H2B type 1-A-like n=1 Tax=Mesoplodon densirostris TaxID=48708 RepID=UPI0028DB97B5|nr:histone H2B type 1-A-like [Mesoplodon densirostris]
MAELSSRNIGLSKKKFKKSVTKTRKNGKKKRRKCRKEDYSVYIYEVLKQVRLETGISSKTLSIMNLFVADTLKRITNGASRLTHYSKRSTITYREIEMIARLLLPVELAKHAVSEGMKAVKEYPISK